jgi:hypothetical protein
MLALPEDDLRSSGHNTALWHPNQISTPHVSPQKVGTALCGVQMAFHKGFPAFKSRQET